ncbi:MAG: DUF559 domain-containing protein, partial [Thermoleophilaceae bacterium]
SPIIHVTVADRGRHRRDGVRLHRVRHLHPDDVTVLTGVPITTIARTLLDFAETARKWELERALEEAERRYLFDLDEIEATCVRNPGRRGIKPLRAILGESFDEPPRTRTDLERDFLDLCRKAGLPEPEINVIVVGHEVDFVWRAHRLVVELDSRTFHARRLAFEADPLRDAALQVAGFRLLRVTRRRLEDEPAGIVKDLVFLANSHVR